MSDSYLLRVGLGTSEVTPLLKDVAKVNRVQRHLDQAYLVMLGEAVKVVDGKGQCLRTDVSELDL